MKGFTILELLISIAIVAGISFISVTSFISFEKREALDATVSAVTAGLRDARTRTMASINGMQYGVQIEQDRFILFQNTYTPNSPTNEITLLSSRIKASSTPNTFLFSKISGNSSASGTIDLYLQSDVSVKKSINIQTTGLISTQ